MFPTDFRQIAHPLTGAAGDYDALFTRLAEGRVVVIGAGTTGTEDFYRERARITRRLIEREGFEAVAVDCDWRPSCAVNRYVRGETSRSSASAALSAFSVFPHWVSRNTEVVDFLAWLRSFNDSRASEAKKVGFYGLDMYGLHGSVAMAIGCLDRTDPVAAEALRRRYACFDHFGGGHEYGGTTELAGDPQCERRVIDLLTARQQELAASAKAGIELAGEDERLASQMARVTKKAPEYYRAMFGPRRAAWNGRARHMAETLDSLVRQLTHKPTRGKVVVWTHNGQAGDARATQMGAQGEWNLGQLARQLYAEGALLIGFTSSGGSVTAASEWGGEPERMRLRPALKNTCENIFSAIGEKAFFITLRDKRGIPEFNEARLQRAVGVVYRPETERESHYYYSRLARQFDAVVHIDESRAVEPLEHSGAWNAGEAAETAAV